MELDHYTVAVYSLIIYCRFRAIFVLKIAISLIKFFFYKN